MFGLLGAGSLRACGRSGLAQLLRPQSLGARCSWQASVSAGVRVCSHSFGQPSPAAFVLAVAPSVGGKSCGRSSAVSSVLSRLPAPPSSPPPPTTALSRPQLHSGSAAGWARPSVLGSKAPCPQQPYRLVRLSGLRLMVVGPAAPAP